MHACSGLTTRLILSYVEREGGRRAVDGALARAGLTGAEAQLRDENAWFAYDDKIALWSAAEEELGDPLIARHAGASVLDFTVGMTLKRALRALGTPEFVFRNVVRANAKFNWAHRLDVLDRGGTRVRLRYLDVSGCGYHRYDCDYTGGLLATIPQLFGLPPARVTHSVCGSRGGSCCEFEVEWTAGLQHHRRAALAIGAAGLAASAAAVAADPGLVPFALAGLAAGELGVAARALRFTGRRLGVLEARVREQDDAADRLLSSLSDLSADLRLDEVLDKITAKAQGAIDGKQFALLLVHGGEVRADRHSGIPPASVAALERWAARNSAALLEHGAIVIDDLACDAELAALPRDRELPLGSICAAPLVSRDQLLGVLVALAHGSTVFLPGDLSALSAYAAHAAIALTNAHLVGRLEREAAEDPLTGLANPRTFQRICAAEFSRAAREGSVLAIVVLDLDHFKAINDAHGHPYGDRVLRDAGVALRGAVRPHDTVARLGGEEFALLLPATVTQDALAVAERARAAIAAIASEGRPLTASAGIASGSPHGTTAEQLLAAADGALYEAKRRGRDCTVVAQAGAGATRVPTS
ncbi:MAG TPA: diguanylate cyclase [Solirubrobacteraceae bacterium]|nr:diguanylate cyclase [Solirubrobacteraceae bacterium]